MYDRRYLGKTLNFEPSGGLMNAALVMRDRETDSWWSIMTGDAIGGELDGTPLKEIPVGEKTQWGDWKRRHSDTKILSVRGREHVDRDPYGRYFSSKRGFRGLSTPDTRLPDKTSIYAFQLDDVAYAVPHSAIEGGGVFRVGGEKEVFLYRKPGSAMFASTFAYIAEGGSDRFVSKEGIWHDALAGTRFSEDTGFPTESASEGLGGGGSREPAGPVRLGGFDTFWYIWSATHRGVTILE